MSYGGVAATPNSCGGTYGGNAVACAAAMATLDVFEQEGILANAAARGSQLQEVRGAAAVSHSRVPAGG